MNIILNKDFWNYNIRPFLIHDIKFSKNLKKDKWIQKFNKVCKEIPRFKILKIPGSPARVFGSRLIFKENKTEKYVELHAKKRLALIYYKCGEKTI
tara:strand:- start:124 stop:411 length:288 start_codon:yes stop_codon:yes gene_type:complete